MTINLTTLKKGRIGFVSLMTFCSILCSCSSVLESAKVSSLTTNYCEPNLQYDYLVIDFPSSENISKQDSILRIHLTPHDKLLSEKISIAPLLAAYYGTTDSLNKLVIKQKITNRLLLVNTELDGIAAELDCNGERIAQLAHYLDGINGKTNKLLTVTSVVVTALTTVATVAVKRGGTEVGVTGGLISAGLGGLTIDPKGKKVNMVSKRNLLKNIWNNDNSDYVYPPSVWNILNEKIFSNSGNQSMIETIKNRWLKFSFNGEAKTDDVALFFNQGGLFRSEDLHTMANMYNELQATVRSIKQDMRSLYIVVNSL